MIVASSLHRRPSRASIVSVVLVAPLVRPATPSAPADDPPTRLTAAQRDELERRATEIDAAVLKHHERGELGPALEKARQSLAIRERIYPRSEFPRGHNELAGSLNDLAILLQAQLNTRESRVYFQRAIEMREALFPAKDYPRGHPDLATSLQSMGSLLASDGRQGEARGYLRRAVEMFEGLYPEAEHPRGHPDLAGALGEMGALLHAQGSFAEARGYLRRAVEMEQSLYPEAKYPRGHPGLALDLYNLGIVAEAQGDVREARESLRRALEMRRRLYPKDEYPRGHPELASSLRGLGSLLQHEGRHAEARGYLQRAVEINQALYPPEQYPRGHPRLAGALSDLGSLLHAQGDYAEARECYRRALEINQALYPPERYPRGRTNLAGALRDLGISLYAEGRWVDAHESFDRAAAMYQALYPEARYPRGHPLLADTLHWLGGALAAEHRHDEALRQLRRAMEMFRAAYPAEKYPRGHANLATTLNDIGFVAHAQGRYDEALTGYRQALEMYRRLYPEDQYPRGHIRLVSGLNNVGCLLLARGDAAGARPYLERAVDMQQDLADVVLPAISEAEALSYLTAMLPTRGVLISAALRAPGGDEAAYARVWRGKSSVTRLLRRRQLALADSEASDPAIHRDAESWRDARRELARLMLTASDGRDHPERIGRIQRLTAEKERLERKLAETIPELARARDAEGRPHTKLVEALPDRCAVFDLVRFTRVEQAPQTPGRSGERRTPSYTAFVLARGRPVRQVDLGPADPINDAVRDWRDAIESGRNGAAAEALRRLAWEPMARHLPPGTDTIIVAPDGALSAIPWAALPGDRPDTVLLEQYALATVPDAPFLLDRLTAPAAPADDRGLVLAVGGVAYGEAPRPVGDDRPAAELLALRPPDTGLDRGAAWSPLPGTRDEVEAVVRLARPRDSLRLEGAEAGAARLLRELPRARWAHIATHGFFADPVVAPGARPDLELMTTLGREQLGVGLRNPLVLTGLVLAGANRPAASPGASPSDRDDPGILTSEAIAALPLRDLELVVLSACETGLGRISRGEGVFGVQRTFHLAGAHDVVASLWKVDDRATAALMALFYDQLWRQHRPPIEALRAAQLMLYRQPDRIGELAQARGTPDFSRVVRRPDPPASGSPRADRAPTRQWAAFVLSGRGR